jgi:hypothetical protein
VLKISKSGREPAARAARVKRPSPHNAAPAPGQAAATGPADAAEGRLRSREGRREACAGFKSKGRPCRRSLRACRAASRLTRRNRGLRLPRGRAKTRLRARKTARNAQQARVQAWPGQGSGRRGGGCARGSRKHFDLPQSWRAVAPHGLASCCSLADSLYEVRCEPNCPAGRWRHERGAVKLRRLETQLSAAFGRTWRLLGLADDAPTALPRGRPPRLE